MRVPALISGSTLALTLSIAPSAAQDDWLSAYPDVREPVHVQLRDYLVANDVFAAMLAPLNEFFPVPGPVTVEMAECGRPGAFYDATRPAVQFCYELITELSPLLDGDGGGEDRFAGAFSVVLLHQVGHAMLERLRLPVRVPTEEAADQFVAVMVGFADDELKGALDGALALNELGVDWENPGSGRAVLTGARLDKLVCLLYGTDPDAYRWVVDERRLAADQALTCAARYEEVKAEWLEMLSEHVRPS